MLFINLHIHSLFKRFFYVGLHINKFHANLGVFLHKQFVYYTYSSRLQKHAIAETGHNNSHINGIHKMDYVELLHSGGVSMKRMCVFDLTGKFIGSVVTLVVSLRQSYE